MYFLCDQVRKINETDKDYRSTHEKRDNISIVCIQLRWCIKSIHWQNQIGNKYAFLYNSTLKVIPQHSVLNGEKSTFTEDKVKGINATRPRRRWACHKLKKVGPKTSWDVDCGGHQLVEDEIPLQIGRKTWLEGRVTKMKGLNAPVLSHSINDTMYLRWWWRWFSWIYALGINTLELTSRMGDQLSNILKLM